jgi:hypothetical protein
MGANETRNSANNQEFTLLKDHNTIYKLIGPALVPQDQNEAKSNVEKRLEFIRSEMYVFTTSPCCPSRNISREGLMVVNELKGRLRRVRRRLGRNVMR